MMQKVGPESGSKSEAGKWTTVWAKRLVTDGPVTRRLAQSVGRFPASLFLMHHFKNPFENTTQNSKYNSYLAYRLLLIVVSHRKVDPVRDGHTYP